MALEVYLKMDDGSGTTVADSSGNGRDFTLLDGGLGYPAWSADAPPGGNGSLEFGPHQSLDVGPNQPWHGVGVQSLSFGSLWTVVAWVKPRVLPPTSDHLYCIIQWRPSASNNWFWITDSGDLWVWDNSPSGHYSTSPITAGSWTEVRISSGPIYGGAFWINGAPAGTFDRFSWFGNTHIGYDAEDISNSNFCDKVMDGHISELQIWSEELIPTPPGGWGTGMIRMGPN